VARISQLILFSLLIGTSSIEETSQKETKSLASSFMKTAGQAIAEGLTIDLPLNGFFWCLGMGSKFGVVVKTAAAAASYMLRKTCNDFIEDEAGNRDLRISTACGLVGGALKYSSRSYFLRSFNMLEPLVGALDGGLYEGTSPFRGNYQTAEIAAIEAIVSMAQYFQGLVYWSDPRPAAPRFSYERLGDAATAGVAVGALVSGTVYTTLTWYGAAIKSWVDAKLSSSHKEETEL